MFLSAAKKNKVTHGLRAVLYASLLVFYAVGALQFNLLHDGLHSHEEVSSHSALDEADGCHRSIYHAVAEKSCGHQSHIVATDHCELCDLIFQTGQILLPHFENAVVEFFSDNSFFNSTDIASIESCVDSSRAPPAL